MFRHLRFFRNMYFAWLNLSFFLWRSVTWTAFPCLSFILNVFGLKIKKNDVVFWRNDALIFSLVKFHISFFFFYFSIIIKKCSFFMVWIHPSTRLWLQNFNGLITFFQLFLKINPFFREILNQNHFSCGLIER